MDRCVTQFDAERAGFTEDALCIPLDVLDGPTEHRAIDAELSESNEYMRIWNGRSVTLAQLQITQKTTLKHAAFETYKRLLDIVGSQRQLLRVWNFIPRVLEEESGIERYRQFNVGRYEAMREHSSTGSPAATGIGSLQGPLIVEALMTSNRTTHLQNPLQTPAPQYSKRFGQRPPLFARGTFHHMDAPELYVAGTASIRRESTVHAGNPALQTETTIENIRSLIGAENLNDHGINHPGFNLTDMADVRVFLKRADDLSVIRPIIEHHFGVDRPITYLRDDICRPDLLVEIEGTARKA